MKSLFINIITILLAIQSGYAQLKVKEHVWQAASPTTSIPDSLKEYDAVMVHKQHDIKNNLDLSAGKIYNIESFRNRIKIYTQSGLEDYSVYSIFKRKYSTITKLDARTIKQDGRVIDLTSSEIKILEIKDDADRDGYENIRVSIPGVEIGDEIEIIYSLENEGFITGRDVHLYTDIPTLKSVFSYTTDNAVITDFRMYNDLPDPVIKRAMNDAVFTWTLTDLSGLGDQYSSDFTESLPFLRFAVRKVIVNGRPLEGLAKWGILNNDWSEIYDNYANIYTNVNFSDLYKGTSFSGYMKKFRAENAKLTTDQLVEKLVNYINDSLEIVSTSDEFTSKSAMYYINTKKIDEKNIHNLIKNYLSENNIKFHIVFARDRTEGKMDIAFASGNMITDVFYASQDSAGNLRFIYPSNTSKKYHLDELPFRILGTEAIMVSRKTNNSLKTDVNKIKIPSYEAVVNTRNTMINIKVNLAGGKSTYKSKNTFAGSFSNIYRNYVMNSLEEDDKNKTLKEYFDIVDGYEVDTFSIDKNEQVYPFGFGFNYQGNVTIGMQKIDNNTYSIPLVGLIDHFKLRTTDNNRILSYHCPFRYIDTYKVYLQFDKSIELLENNLEDFWIFNSIGNFMISINKVNDKVILIESKLDLRKEKLSPEEYVSLFKTNENINKSTQARILFKTM